MIENMTFGSGASSLPEGSYFGEFVAVDKVENKFQPGKGALRWASYAKMVSQGKQVQYGTYGEISSPSLSADCELFDRKIPCQMGNGQHNLTCGGDDETCKQRIYANAQGAEI